jgi:general secretion pathway protein C
LGGDLSRLFGAAAVAAADAAPTPVNTRFKLVGVMAGRTTEEGTAPGLALISIDDKPPRPFVAGSRVEDQLILKSVSHRSASLGPANGVATIVLEVPPLPAPATGMLSPAAGIEPATPEEQPTSSPQVQAGERPELVPQFAPPPQRRIPGVN